MDNEFGLQRNAKVKMAAIVGFRLPSRGLSHAPGLLLVMSLISGKGNAVNKSLDQPNPDGLGLI